MRTFDIFSDNNSFDVLAAFVCSLTSCTKSRILEHPYDHSVEALADDVNATFKFEGRKCATATTRRRDQAR